MTRLETNHALPTLGKLCVGFGGMELAPGFENEAWSLRFSVTGMMRLGFAQPLPYKWLK